MINIKNCPICGDLMKTIKYNNLYLKFINKTSNYIEHTCCGINHLLQITIDKFTKNIDTLKMSLAPDYSRFIMIDFYNKKCKIILLKNSKEEYIFIPKIVFPDFPNLSKLKEQINTYIIFM